MVSNKKIIGFGIIAFGLFLVVGLPLMKVAELGGFEEYGEYLDKTTSDPNYKPAFYANFEDNNQKETSKEREKQQQEEQEYNEKYADDIKLGIDPKSIEDLPGGFELGPELRDAEKLQNQRVEDV